mmetsp:Transcript_35468/g.85825  ORF Transcript_35468/g.85825 Transcript_35468/m.85825 type:complete len:535 (-) Transcript_35468:115-1719(-)
MSYLLIVAACVLVAAAAYYYFSVVRPQQIADKKKSDRGKNVDVDETLSTNSVGLEDITYVVSKLSPNCTYLDVLLAIASSPESVVFGTKTHLRKLKMVSDRKEQDEKEEKELRKKGSGSGNDNGADDTGFNLDDDGWADDDEEDDENIDEETKTKLKLAKQAEEEKAKAREELNKTTGKVKVPLEDVDDDVLGMVWVEKTLKAKGVWPPKDMKFLKDMKFDYEGTDHTALDHPGLHRNMLHLYGRIYSNVLNGHPELLEAASKQKIDPSYFRSSQEYRQRCAILLEAVLRTSVSLRNYKVAAAVLDAVCVFKIGCDSPDKTEWFNDIMMKQYGTLPRLTFSDITLENSQPVPEMASGDVLLMSLDLTRLHAEAFTRQKVAMFQKNGIPPQVGLAQYREGWWYFLRAELLDGEADVSSLPIKKEGILSKVEDEDLDRFRKAPYEDRLLTAWPMIVQNVAQKSGKVKINFKCPTAAGKYKFTVSVKSQEFLGADQDFSVEAAIVDIATLDREPTMPPPPPKQQAVPVKPAEAKKDE